jgi:hypothetical protein
MLSCSPCRYVIEIRQYGLLEHIPLEKNLIVHIDTIKNDLGGAIKEVQIRVKICN